MDREDVTDLILPGDTEWGKRLDQRKINGQRQYVWTYPVLDPSEVKQGVKYRVK